MRKDIPFIILNHKDSKVQPFVDVGVKAAYSPRLFQDPEWWSGRVLNQLTLAVGDATKVVPKKINLTIKH